LRIGEGFLFFCWLIRVSLFLLWVGGLMGRERWSFFHGLESGLGSGMNQKLIFYSFFAFFDMMVF